jgi:multidrug efflux pump subunit AcrA (membrane-fusion protein)
MVESSVNLNTTGKIKRKSLAAKNPQMQSAIKTYEVLISVDSCHSRLKPGLSATCRIIVDHVKDTVVVPTAAIFSMDSSKIVYVAQGEKFIPVTVETGFSNSSNSIISKGLEGNETITLTEPPHNLIGKEVKTKTDTTITSPSDKSDTVLIKSAH